MSLCPHLSGVPHDDACGIIQEAGCCWKAKDKRMPVALRLCPTGINYMIWLYTRKYRDPSDPIYAFLRFKLNDEQFGLVVRMRDMTPIEAKMATNSYFDKILTKTKKEKPYVDALGAATRPH